MKEQPPPPTNKGVAWWRTLSLEEKVAIIQPLIERFGMTNKEISEYLDLDSIGRVAHIRHEIKKRKDREHSGPQLVSSTPEPLIDAQVLREAFHELEFEQQAALIQARLVGTWSPQSILRPLTWLGKSHQEFIKRQAAVFLIETGRR